jgi:hypothetical protein
LTYYMYLEHSSRIGPTLPPRVGWQLQPVFDALVGLRRGTSSIRVEEQVRHRRDGSGSHILIFDMIKDIRGAWWPLRRMSVTPTLTLT